MRTRLVLLILLTFFSVCGTRAESFPDLSPSGYVNDFAGILESYHEQLLEKKISDFNDSTSCELAIVTVTDLRGYSPAMFANTLAQEWGVGKKEHNNGILILIKPKIASEKGRIFISVGYGLEAVIPDAMVKRIINRTMIPSFRENRYYTGLDEGLNHLFSLASTEFRYSESKPEDVYYKYWYPILILLILTLALPFLYMSYLGRRKIPASFSHCHINGEYNLVNLLEQLNRIEIANGREYPGFRHQLKKYKISSRGNMFKYSSRIDRNIFCLLLDGRSRSKLFFRFCDPFLKVIFLYLFILFLGISVFFEMLYGWSIFLLSLGISFLMIYMLAGLLVNLLEIYRFTRRKDAKFTGGVSMALFTLNLIFMRNLKKKFDPSSGKYYYYPVITYAGSGGSGGGFSGGGGFGGFSGGSFGGGGAGGSW